MLRFPQFSLTEPFFGNCCWHLLIFVKNWFFVVNQHISRILSCIFVLHVSLKLTAPGNILFLTACKIKSLVFRSQLNTTIIEFDPKRIIDILWGVYIRVVMSWRIVLTSVDNHCEKSVFHLSVSRCSEKEVKINFVRIVKIGHYFCRPYLWFFELVSFEGQEKNRRKRHELPTFINKNLLFLTATFPKSSVYILS